MQNAPDNDDEEPATRKNVSVRRPLAFKKAAIARSEDVTGAGIDEAAERFASAQQKAEERRRNTDALIEAIHARAGAEVLSALIDKGVDFNAYDAGGDSMMHLAVHCRNTTALILLINAGMDVHVKNFDGMTPLMEACRGYEMADCGVILATVDPDLSFHTVDGVHALHIAAYDYKKTRLVEKLLERGVPADIEDKEGRTPLWYALAAKRECMEVLCMAGGFRKKDLPTLREAIAIKSVYSNDWDYDLLLQRAAKHDQSELKKSFPACGQAPVSLPDEAGRELFDKIDHCGGESSPFRKFHHDTAALQARNFDGKTPVMVALGGNTSIWATADLVWESDAKARDNGGRTPLHYAVTHVASSGGYIGGSFMMRGDVNAQDIFGRTPLMVSVSECGDHIDTLISKGADLGLKDKLGLTALDIAKIRKSDYAVEKLTRTKEPRKSINGPGMG